MMRVLCVLLAVSVALGRPQRDCGEDGSSDVESDAIAQQQELQHGHNQDVKQEAASRLVDYGGSSVQPKTRSQPLGTPKEEADQEDSSDVEVEELSHAENNAEFRENFKDKDLIRAPIDSPKNSASFRAKESYYSNKGDNAYNTRQAQHDRDKSNTRRSQSSADHHKIQSDSSEGDKRIIHQTDLKFNNDEKVNNEALSENSNKNPSYAADYEMEDASQNPAASANEDSVPQKENESSFESNNDPAEYGNLDIEETRERREVKNETPKIVTTESKPELAVIQQTNNLDVVANEETVEAKDQLAIKKYIANLSNDQLNDLLGSLPTDKRELLQQIISNDRAETNKREVSINDETAQLNDKQETANAKLQESAEKTPESRVNHESGPTQAEKMANEPVALNNNEGAVSNKEIEVNPKEPQSAIAAEDNSKAEVTNRANIQKAVASSDIVSHEVNVRANGQSNIKSETESEKSNIKREVKTNDYNNLIEESEGNSDSSIDFTEENNSAGSKDGPSFISKKFDSNGKMLVSKRNTKRENPSKKECINRDPIHALKEDLSIAEQIQALEESFPSVRSYDEPSYTPHLVRVKRNKRENLEKRSASALLGSETVIPYRADTEDEDDDEGNEFEDDGLFDRTSNLGGEDQAKASMWKPIASDETVQNKDNVKDYPQTDTANIDAQPKFNVLENAKVQDLSSIGSDSDNVLSGSDGVDENLMLTSGVRSRFSRKSDRNLNELGEGSDTSQLEGSKKTATEELQSVQIDPNGAFGGLPKNYDGELSRFKRIRRTKKLDE